MTAAYTAHPEATKRARDAGVLQDRVEGACLDLAAALNLVKESAYQLLGDVAGVNPKDPSECYFMSKIGGPETSASIKARLESNEKAAKKSDATKAKKANQGLEYPVSFYDEKDKNGVVNPRSLNQTVVDGNMVMHAVVLAATISPGDVEEIVGYASQIVADKKTFDDVFSTSDKMVAARKDIFGALVDDEGKSRLAATDVPDNKALYLSRMAAATIHLNHSDNNKVIAAIITAFTRSTNLPKDGVTYHPALAAALATAGEMLMGMRYILPAEFIAALAKTYPEDDPLVATEYGVAKLGKKKKKFAKEDYPHAINLPASIKPPAKRMAKNSTIKNFLRALHGGKSVVSADEVAQEYRTVLTNGPEAPGMTNALMNVISALQGVATASLAEGDPAEGIAGIKAFCQYMFAPGAATVLPPLMRYLRPSQISTEDLEIFFGNDESLSFAGNYIAEQKTTPKMVILLGTLLSGL